MNSKENSTLADTNPKAARDERLIQMRAAGMTYRQIAQRFDIGVATAHRQVTAALERRRDWLHESRDDVRDLDLQKLEWVETKLVREAAAGDLKATQVLLACIRMRRQYIRDDYGSMRSKTEITHEEELNAMLRKGRKTDPKEVELWGLLDDEDREDDTTDVA